MTTNRKANFDIPEVKCDIDPCDMQHFAILWSELPGKPRYFIDFGKN